MLQSGIFLAAASAFLCGWADVSASLGARRLGAARTTFLALAMGTVLLVLFGLLSFPRLGLTAQTLLRSMPLGMCVGALTASGYAWGYRGMSLGPMAIVGPIVATDGAVAAALAILLLHEGVDSWQVATLGVIFAGVILCSASGRELARLLQPACARKAISWRGVPWGMLAAASFGLMLFALGAESQVWGWYLSMLWSRFFGAAFVLAAIVTHRRFRRRAPRGGGSEQGKGERRWLLQKGPILALVGGLCETAGLAMFSLSAQIADSTAIVAVIASAFVLIPLVFGVLYLGERPAMNQWVGVALVLLGLALLGFKPA
jgi:drug/metabolite transporter (DMT)-like permease